MDIGLPLFPEQASTMAAAVDGLYFFLIAITVFFSGLIFLLLLVFAIRYRRRAGREVGRAIEGNLKLEAVWIVIPLAIVMVVFFWSARVFFAMSTPPPDALDIYGIGKQWMWKFQHPGGQREINELHVPMGQPVRLTMSSEDVIHSFYVPAFRVKKDVIPGRYSSVWFEATKTGEFHLFCAEYCGTEHAGMIGRVIVMKPAEYQQWLSGGTAGETMAQAGERLFNQFGCATCHRADPTARGPSLIGLFGQPVQLASGATVIADERYLRQSIVAPREQMAAGYQPIMPTFEGLISEEGLLQIIAYIKSLGTGESQRVQQ